MHPFDAPLSLHEYVVGSVHHDFRDLDPPSLLRWARPVAARSHPGKDASVERPGTRFARNGGAALAYQVFGVGLVDLVYVQGRTSHVDVRCAGARVGAMAGTSEVWVSSTVKDLVVGSGLAFEDAGEHELKRVPDRCHLSKVLT